MRKGEAVREDGRRRARRQEVGRLQGERGSKLGC